MVNKNILQKKIYLENGNEYIYWVAGEKTNQPLVIFYGYTGVYADFVEIVEKLVNKYYIIIPEYPGWGKNKRFKEKLTIENYARYFDRLINHLSLSSVSILAHCMGSVSAIEYIYLFPNKVKNIVIISTPYIHYQFAWNLFAILARLTEKSPKFIRPIYFFWRSRIIGVPLDFIIIKIKDRRKKLKRIYDHIVLQFSYPEDATQEQWISYVDYDFSKVKKIKSTVHLLHGKLDLLLPIECARKLHQLFQNATLDILEQGGHTPPVESADEVVEYVYKYIK